MYTSFNPFSFLRKAKKKIYKLKEHSQRPLNKILNENSEILSPYEQVQYKVETILIIYMSAHKLPVFVYIPL